MALLRLRSFAVLSALFAPVTACGLTTPEAVRPAPDSSAPAPSTSAADPPTLPPGELVMSQDACKSDADCVPASCCHPTACRSASKAQPCSLMCTQVCEPGTLDCGGACLCRDGRCAAKLGNGGR